MSALTIYIRLRQAGMSAVGACAMMGNMKLESGLKANNVENRCPISDEDYTAQVDAGVYADFATDNGKHYGYGLCQWTYSTRKLNLLNFARKRGVSIGDETMQVDFCIQELRTEYPMLWLYLCDCTGIAAAAERICKEYERPAVNNVQVRAEAANQFYMALGGMEISAGGASSSPTWEGKEESYWPPRTLELGMFGPDVVALQGLLIAHGYPAGISGTFDSATRLKTMAFQAEQGLVGDGIAGPLTWAQLKK